MGKEGERLIHKLLEQCGYYTEDVSNNQAYFDKDIDIIATEQTLGIRATIEVKYDTRIARTHNFFMEFYNPRSKDNKGWLKFCQADFLYYIDAQNQLLHIFKVQQLKDYIKKYESYFRIAETDDGARGYLLSEETAPIYNTISLEGLRND